MGWILILSFLRMSMAAGLRRPKLPGTLGNHGPWALVFYKVHACLFAYCSFLSHGKNKYQELWWCFIYLHLLIIRVYTIYSIWHMTYDLWYTCTFESFHFFSSCLYPHVMSVCIVLYTYIERHRYLTCSLIWLPRLIVKGFTLSPHRVSIIMHKKHRGWVYMNACAQYESVFCWISMFAGQVSALLKQASFAVWKTCRRLMSMT